jgi:hypothetical protein
VSALVSRRGGQGATGAGGGAGAARGDSARPAEFRKRVASGEVDPQRLARMRARMGGAEVTPEMLARMRGRMGGDTSGRGAGSRGAGASGAWNGSASSGSQRTQIAIVKTAKGFEARAVRIGISDFDYAEVLAGLEEGDQVAMLSYAEMKAQRERVTSFARSRMSGGLTTQTTTSRTGNGTSSGGSSGGRPSGGGPPPAGGP